jgi:UPF0716 family protein affecting phage T7 exclusion
VPRLLGIQVADTVFVTQTYQVELLDGYLCINCVTMLVRGLASDSAEICLLLPATEAAVLKRLLACYLSNRNRH